VLSDNTICPKSKFFFVFVTGAVALAFALGSVTFAELVMAAGTISGLANRHFGTGGVSLEGVGVGVCIEVCVGVGVGVVVCNCLPSQPPLPSLFFNTNKRKCKKFFYLFELKCKKGERERESTSNNLFI
jgi:hypothetical protein